MEGSILLAALVCGAVALVLVVKAPVLLRRLLTPEFEPGVRR